ncbi:hypothetical protein FC24_GL001582 [Loigolactobacillus rennini DSM 20253]|uniref:Bacterial microcompartment domain-containing protein n=1 Tax=Loigolactobacillus rennini DSM 20253 TaxID=1423796 RepID=A0A0R2CZ93_9LACO|nr:hypothetical protein FC24_GL001582 [Loigolactobacillus rennini DSM 20253]
MSQKDGAALGILTITPSEASIIAADIAVKAGDIKLGFLDRFSGSLVVIGEISSVESAVKQVTIGLERILHFSVTPAITYT